MAIKVPRYLTGSVDLGFRTLAAYRVFMVAVGAVMVGALWYGFERTSLGARIRAAVEQRLERLNLARIDDPERQAETRIVGHDDIPAQVGDTIRLEAYRVVTDRAAGVVRFDCRLVS